MSSQMDDHKAGDELNEGDRFRSSKTTTIHPGHAVLRCVAGFNGATVTNSQIVKAFFEAGSSRVWDPDELEEVLSEGVQHGYLEKIEGVGYRLTDNGRNEIGPMMEMDLKYV